MKIWNKKKRDCRNCKHFYVCSYQKQWKIRSILEEHLGDCLEIDNIKRQTKAMEIVDELFCKYCKYFNKDAYSNTYNWAEKPKKTHKSNSKSVEGKQ